MGTGYKANVLHLIDFGLCKLYRDPSTYEHIPMVTKKNLTGTARYASTDLSWSIEQEKSFLSAGIYAHQGCEQSRRDDLQSLMYIFVYLSKGELPWMGIKCSDKQKKYELIAVKKLNIPSKDLFAQLPKESLILYEYIHSLKFDEKPDYIYIRSQIRSMFLQYQYQYDYIYDWYYRARRMKTLLEKEMQSNLAWRRFHSIERCDENEQWSHARERERTKDCPLMVCIINAYKWTSFDGLRTKTNRLHWHEK